MDTLLSMKVFRRVAEGGSFVAAADALDLSKSMVSKHVRHLEAHLHVRLLHRTTRKLRLTEDGASYLARCVAMLDELEEAETALLSRHRHPSGRLRITAPDGFGVVHLPPVIERFLSKYRDTSIEIALNNQNVDLIEEGLDVAVRVGHLEHSSLIARRLCTARLVVCAAPEYLSRHGVPRAPEDLGKHLCIGYSGGGSWAKHWTFGPKGSERQVEINPRLVADTGPMQLQGALAGLGVALLPTYNVGSDLSAGRLRALLTDYPLPELSIYAIYPTRKHLSAKVRLFVDLLAETFVDPPAWDAWMNVAQKRKQ
jgi:DNA-binding transcriptional LysR family regulator